MDEQLIRAGTPPGLQKEKAMAMLPQDRASRWTDIFRKYGIPTKKGQRDNQEPMTQEAFHRMQRDPEALFLDPLWRANRPRPRADTE